MPRAVLRFLLSSLAATAGTGPVVAVVELWMNFEIIAVDGGRDSWLLAIGAIAAIGVCTSIVVGLPVRGSVARFPRLARRRAVAVPLVAAAVSTGLFALVSASLAPTAADLGGVFLVAAVFFAIEEAVRGILARPRSTA